MDKLQQNFRKLIKSTTSKFHRYMYHQVDWSTRLVGLTGPRGVGKTTMILQHIKNNIPLDESLYVTAEDFYFANHKLLDLANEFTQQGGKYLFIDEVHKYKDWSRELKLIYDYHPELMVVFTGSSVLDINKGVADLSRRAVMYHMQGLSFREYLELFKGIIIPTISLEDILLHKIELPSDFKPLAHFKDYLQRGYYPFSNDTNFDTRLMQIINQTIETDIPLYADMNVSTARKLKQLLGIIAQSMPFKPNISKIAELLGASRNNIADYCLYIEEAGFISQLRDKTGGIRGLGKADKIYLDNTNLMYSLGQSAVDIGSARETFFMNQLRVIADVVTSKVADFEVDGRTFEVGGRNKKQKQVAQVHSAYIIKDDIEEGWGNTIPLWTFGLLY